MAVSRINEAGLNVNQYGNRNIIYNGAMQVAQRGTSFTGLGGSTGAVYNLDRFHTFDSATAGRATVTQESDGPDGFANSLKMACTTADTSVAAGEIFMLSQRLEGQDLQQFAKGTSSAKPFTVSFYVKGNAAATYIVELIDTDNSRQCSKTFSVTTAWTRIELTFPADTTGVLDDDNARSFDLNIWLHAGSTYTSGTLNSSAFASTTNANRAVGGSSFFDSTSRTFFITGVQMEVGDTATDFEHRTFGDELAKCQRYFLRSYDYGTATGTATSTGSQATTAAVSQSYASAGTYNFPVEMRATPTVTLYSTANASTTGKVSADGTDGTGSASFVGTNSVFILRSNDGGGVAANVIMKAHLIADAEL